MPSSRKKSRADTHLRLSLIENAYNFLNQSLRHYRQTSRNIEAWPFALLHITQSIELMLKHLLTNAHPILIFDDVDRRTRTVSLEQALTRLEAVGVSIGEKEKVNIRKASHYRNLIVHYEITLNKFEWKNVYAQLFEFVHFFHHEHLSKEIHSHIAKDNWPVEARLMAYFRKNFVLYNGMELVNYYPREIVAAQRITSFSNGNQQFDRIKYGDEPGWLSFNTTFADIPCHDCGVVKGQFHVENCDVEECPKCHQQLLGCECW
jgi:HEPN domain-containing protein